MTKPLDIRDWKEKGNELKKAITQAVKDTQRVLITTLPDRIIMSKKQYKDLTGSPELMQTANGQEHSLYRTLYNVMEVQVK